jgi:hypothetical protein
VAWWNLATCARDAYRELVAWWNLATCALDAYRELVAWKLSNMCSGCIQGTCGVVKLGNMCSGRIQGSRQFLFGVHLFSRVGKNHPFHLEFPYFLGPTSWNENSFFSVSGPFYCRESLWSCNINSWWPWITLSSFSSARKGTNHTFSSLSATAQRSVSGCGLFGQLKMFCNNACWTWSEERLRKTWRRWHSEAFL